MFDKNLLDQWLAVYFHRQVKTQSIGSLQNDVWRKIRLIESEQPENWFERLLAVFLAPERQFASVMAVLVVSIALGFSGQPYSAMAAGMPAKALGFEVFSPLYSHPLNKN